jgi:hypothetical protein
MKNHLTVIYIILKKFVNLKKYFFQITKYMEQKYWIFKNILFLEINIFKKLIN